MLLRPRTKSEPQLPESAKPGSVSGGEHGVRPSPLALRAAQAPSKEDRETPQESEQEAREAEPIDRFTQEEAEDQTRRQRHLPIEEGRRTKEDHQRAAEDKSTKEFDKFDRINIGGIELLLLKWQAEQGHQRVPESHLLSTQPSIRQRQFENKSQPVQQASGQREH